ncbi:V-type proton ATPase subunit G 1 [Schistosoma japonicum]|uniref:V-type proton ATPase subunit G n=1 Tax=Schistosoma japonicum TaxID=6182 RepID=C1LLJ8_SCHJA|nr:V-type proton ATPase subunit G 1 [Schistosoma japonicum]CAX75576.1 ATPase, H+ transporting, lysosomal 13kDa, V1 subunit G1 [Schistosoma japonicum]
MSAVAVQSDGVAKLQQARTAALAKIEEARNRRAKRLKEAKGEANLEIEAFKSQQEAHYNSLELQVCTSFVTDFAQVNSQYGPHEEICNKMTIEQLDLLQRSFQSNKNKALQLLLSKVLDVKPVVHVNFGFKSPGSQ